MVQNQMTYDYSGTTEQLTAGILALVYSQRCWPLSDVAAVESLAAFQSPLIRRFHCKHGSRDLLL